jgi:diguanylate cyclase (GGDEF)-like protein/PAS domain S-box-containing protein
MFDLGHSLWKTSGRRPAVRQQWVAMPNGREMTEPREDHRLVGTGPALASWGLVRSLVAVSILNLFVIAITSFVLMRSCEQERDKTILVADNLSRELDENLSQLIDKIDLTLLAVADEAERQVAAGGIDRRLFESALARHDGRLPEAIGLRVSNAEGQIKYAVSHVEASNVDVSDREYFTRQRDNPNAGLFISAPFVGQLFPHPQIIFSRRYRAADGTFAGIVSAAVAIDSLSTILSTVNPGPRGNVSLWDDRLNLMARYSRIPIPDMAAAKPSPSLAELIREGADPTTYHTNSGADGVERQYFLRKVSRWPLYLTVGLADDDFMVGWWREVIYLSCLTGLFMLGSVAAFVTFHRAMRALQTGEERYRALFSHMQAGFSLREIITDDDGRPVDCRFLVVNQPFLDILGLRSEDVVGKTLTEACPDTARDATDWIAIYSKVVLTGESVRFESFGEASRRWVEVTAYRTAPQQFAVLLNDITERKQAEQKIQELAYFDGLTKLPNRRLLMDRLSQALIAGARSKRKGGLLFVDLDDFKMLNDTFGHGAGDLLLQQVARRLTSSVREGDTVARLGGDEFVVMLEDLNENPPDAAAQIKVVGEKILAALSQPYVLSSREHQSTASIGAALFGETRESLSDLLKRADIAMYQAKSAGRNTLRFFDPALQAAVKARAMMEEALRQAIRRAEFRLYYQPQVDRGSLIGAEALIRWQHPERGIVLPDEFIPLAEETGLILPLGQWVLETACRQIATWAGRKETRQINLAVNVSARQFRQADFVDQVLRVLERTTADPHNLKLELTESMLVDNVEDVIVKMTALKSRGLSFSLDDFGTGYSSLSYLRRLPLDQLKIDQSFVKEVLADLNSGAIAQTIIALGQTMGLSVIAEGVETEEQRDFLTQLGCPAFQGYLLSRPVPVEEFERLMNTRFQA